MKKINIRHEDGTFKKWFKRSMVGLCCTTILGVGIGGICISGTHPWSEIASSAIITPETWKNEIPLNNPTFKNDPFTIEVLIKNHNGAQAKTLLNSMNNDFDPAQQDNHGYILWAVNTDLETRKILRYIDIKQEDGTTTFNIPSEGSNIEKGFEFNLYIEALVYVENPSFTEDPLVLVSEAMPMICV